MDVSLESVPRKGLLYEKVSSLPSVQRSYISDSARLLSLLMASESQKREEKWFGEQSSAEELVMGESGGTRL
jgi:hypothetical protein